MSHIEVCGLQNLEKQMGVQRMVVGSTAVMGAREFVESLVPQRKKLGERDKGGKSGGMSGGKSKATTMENAEEEDVGSD